jgi:hypothetical protein
MGMDGWIWTSLEPQLLDEFYSCLVFNSSFFTGRCMENMNILAPQNRALQTGHKKHNGMSVVFNRGPNARL